MVNIEQERCIRIRVLSLTSPPSQLMSRLGNLVVPTTTVPASLTSAVNHELHEVDHDLPLYNVVTMDQRAAGSWLTPLHRSLMGPLSLSRWHWPASSLWRD